MIKWLISIIIIIASAIMVIALPYKPNYTLTWDAPTAFTDGTLLPVNHITGYKVYWSDISGKYLDIDSKDVGNILTAQTPAVMGRDPQGTFYYVITAHDATGIESPFSNEVSRIYKKQSNSPGNLR